MNEVEYMQPSPKFYDYEIPTNFNCFIEKQYYLMTSLIRIKVRKDNDEVESILHDFIVYMFEKDTLGRVRYKKYNSIKYPDVPYSKWFLSNLKFYIKNYWRSLKRDFLYVPKYLDEVDLDSNDSLLYANHYFDDQDSLVFLNEVYSFLKNYSKNQIKSFDFNAYTLFKLKMEGYSNIDLAQIFEVIPVTIYSWLSKLRSLIYKNLDIDILFEDRGLYIKNLIRT